MEVQSTGVLAFGGTEDGGWRLSRGAELGAPGSRRSRARRIPAPRGTGTWLAAESEGSRGTAGGESPGSVGRLFGALGWRSGVSGPRAAPGLSERRTGTGANLLFPASSTN